MRARSAMWGLASNDSRRAELADEALILVWGEMEMDRCGGGDVGFRSQRVWLIRWFRNREEGGGSHKCRFARGKISFLPRPIQSNHPTGWSNRILPLVSIICRSYPVNPCAFWMRMPLLLLYWVAQMNFKNIFKFLVKSWRAIRNIKFNSKFIRSVL